MSEASVNRLTSGRRAAFGFIFVSALMNSISFGIMIPILPNLVKQFAHGDTASASDWNAVFAASWGLMQFLCGPILGMLADRFGRRPVLLISIFGLFADFLFMAFAPTLGWLFLGRLINGITASSFSTANAYVADVTAPENRARYFGLMGSAFGFGFIIGPAIGGFLGEYSLRLPFVAAAALCLVNGLYGLFILPESLPPESRSSGLNWKSANPLASLHFLRQHGELIGLATVAFLFALAQNVLPSIFVLYTGYRYHWTPKTLGLTFMLTGVCQILVAVAVVGPTVKRIGERGAALVGCACAAFAFFWYGLAPQGWIYLLATPIFALSGLIQPGVMGLMSRRVGPKFQGRLQGVNQSFVGIGSIVGPLLYGETFSFAVRHDSRLHLPGLSVLIAGSLLTLAFLVALKTARAAPATA